MDEWYNKAEKSNKGHKSSPYRILDEVQLMRSRIDLLDLCRDIVEEDENVIFIKDRKETPPTKLLVQESKKLRRLSALIEE